MSETFAEEIRSRRVVLDLSQIALADIAGVSRGTVRNAETGNDVDGRTALKLRTALDRAEGRAANRGNLAADEGDRSALARAVMLRRREIGWTQRQASDHGDISTDRLQAFEAGRLKTAIRFSTLNRLDEAMCWEPGSALAVLNGGAPTEVTAPDEPRKPPADGVDIEVGVTDGSDQQSTIFEPTWSVDEAGHLHVFSDGDLVTTFAAGYWRYINKDAPIA